MYNVYTLKFFFFKKLIKTAITNATIYQFLYSLSNCTASFFIFYCFRVLLQILFLKLRKFKRINEPLLANKAKYIYQCYICYYKLPHSLQILEKIFDHDFELQEFVGNLFDKLNYEKKICMKYRKWTQEYTASSQFFGSLICNM